MARKQWLYILRPTRPAMLTEGPTAAEQASVQRHVAYHVDLASRGIDIMVGRTQTNTPDTIGVSVFFAEDEAAARVIMLADPTVADGVMTGELFAYRIAMGNAESMKEALDG